MQQQHGVDGVNGTAQQTAHARLQPPTDNVRAEGGNADASGDQDDRSIGGGQVERGWAHSDGDDVTWLQLGHPR